MTESTQVTLLIDGQSVTVPKGTTVYHAAQKIKAEIPIFCYQDRMPPFGACRMCLVEVEKMPKLQTSCTLEAKDGMVIFTKSEKALKEREGILEFLLINHPLDCPICDRAGECPLQENTFRHGPGLSRFFEEKRHFKKALPLGPVLMLDRERCIICARCTRFSDLVSGDHALEMKDRGFKSEIGTPDNAPIKSKFIGNTIAICPVGALTSEVYRFKARPWDNTQTTSSCTLCPVGCSKAFDSRDGEVMRTRAVENKDLNDMWLCDKGYFGYEFIDHPDRLKTPLIRKAGKLEEASWDEALSLIAEKISHYKPSKKLASIGGNPLTTEENYLFQQFTRQCLEVNNLDHRLDGPLFNEAEAGISAGMEMSIGAVENLEHVLLLGLDLTEEFPVIWLRLKQAINKNAHVIFAGHYAPEIAPHLNEVHLHSPQDELEVIDKLLKNSPSNKSSAIFVGKQYLQSKNRLNVLTKLASFCKENVHVKLNIMEGSGNSLGASFAGMRPDCGPNGVPLQEKGLNSLQIFKESSWDYLHVAGANPAIYWDNFRARLQFLVVQDLFLTETASVADVVLPTLCYVEKAGSFVNIEGRIQKLKPAKIIPENLRSDGSIFKELAKKLHYTLSIDENFAEILQTTKIPLQRKIVCESKIEASKAKVTNHLLVSLKPFLFDEGVRMQHNKHLSQLIVEPKAKINEDEARKRNINANDKIKISTEKGHILLPVEIDKNIASQTIILPLGFKSIALQNLAAPLYNGQEVQIEKVNL